MVQQKYVNRGCFLWCDENNYKKNRTEYLVELRRLSKTGNYRDFIITGAADPTLNSIWLEDVLDRLRDVHTELQTKNYNINPNNFTGVDVLAYSITNSKEYLSAFRYPRLIGGTNRLVILLTKEMSFLTPTNFEAMDFDQITFKVLQETADEKTNKWIEENKMEDLTNIYAIVDKFNGRQDVSVRLDSSCQDSHGRYEIYRADGKIYKTWDEE